MQRNERRVVKKKNIKLKKQRYLYSILIVSIVLKKKTLFIKNFTYSEPFYNNESFPLIKGLKTIDFLLLNSTHYQIKKLMKDKTVFKTSKFQ